MKQALAALLFVVSCSRASSESPPMTKEQCLEMVQHIAEVSGTDVTPHDIEGCNRTLSATKATYDCVMAAKTLDVIANDCNK